MGLWIFSGSLGQLKRCKRQEQACYLPETPAAMSVFIATGSGRAAEDERALPGASVKENSSLSPPHPACVAFPSPPLVQI